MTWITHLLPKSFLWKSSASVLRIFTGVQDWFDDAREKFDFGLLENRPSTTSDVFERLVKAGISLRFLSGISEADARSLLTTIEPRSTGQAAARLEEILQSAGFDVYVYEWFEPGTGPTWAERNPVPYLSVALAGLMHCDDSDATCDSSIAYCDDWLVSGGNWLTNQSLIPRAKTPPQPTSYHGLFYVCGPTFGEIALIDPEKRELLEYLILRYKRATQWAVLIVDYGESLLTEDGESLIFEDGEGLFL